MEEGIPGIPRDLLNKLQTFEQELVKSHYEWIYQLKTELIKKMNTLIDEYDKKIISMETTLETGIKQISKQPITNGDRNNYTNGIPKRRKQIEWLNQRKIKLDDQVEQGIGKEIKEVLSYILELINELDPEDGVTVQEVFDYASENYSRVTTGYIRTILNSIAKVNEGYKFVRLKDTIRKIDRTSIEIEKFITQIEKQELGKSGKDL